ncbi:hypothetical protein V6N12_029681 [Hibiscus sabdariffa]|uniref:Uncharacterized protein n=1 Tax=Hibiscus sabdariffa TaxID=183260 RepID=A0ABR2CWU3_9ROSI
MCTKTTAAAIKTDTKILLVASVNSKGQNLQHDEHHMIIDRVAQEKDDEHNYGIVHSVVDGVDVEHEFPWTSSTEAVSSSR